MSLAEHVGREVQITTLGRTWKFSRWTRKVWAEFTAEAQKRIPNPLVEANLVLPDWSRGDAETLRLLIQADREEQAKAREEGREPILVSDKFRPNSDLLVEKSIDKRNLYLGFQSKELQSYLFSVPGMSFVFFLLLKPNHPEITDEDAYDVMISVGPTEQARIVQTTQGIASESPKNELAPAV